VDAYKGQLNQGYFLRACRSKAMNKDDSMLLEGWILVLSFDPLFCFALLCFALHYIALLCRQTGRQE